ncbi:EscU/YscU/HrcU family type III secretion system export apparatus switch protein [Tautonia plasticadhaerens]|uniref:Flagellar biosynthetic protein FlhB n=1 Tax=Tautonia plasticadhaerens TaxID=2527974 RepID=A0A518HCY6_9BACT|nr:EscU/YscU/HrcU family type III secretion system export apparatus switch protein [Tautonia plasticadhaerens]QDV38683.1 Flagellar biosynthetic protein FlhB [Tautonia plasticadhaerens]
MSDDRTLEPSPRRLREARDRGMVPVSGELTAAVGLLAASAALGVWGEGLLSGMLGLIREGLSGEDLAVADASTFVALVRSAIGSVASPMAVILAVPVLASLVAHQVQAGGLFRPGLALPDPARLRPGASAGTPGDRLGRAAGLVARAVVLVALTWWAIRGVLRDPAASTASDPSEVIRLAGGTLHASISRLGLALLAVGLVHRAVQVRRLDARLRISPREQREEQREQGGNPGIRARLRAGRRGEPAPGVAEPAGPGAI